MNCSKIIETYLARQIILWVGSLKRRSSKYLDQISLRRVFQHVGMWFIDTAIRATLRSVRSLLLESSIRSQNRPTLGRTPQDSPATKPRVQRLEPCRIWSSLRSSLPRIIDALPLSQRDNYCIFHVVKTPPRDEKHKSGPPKGPIPDWSLYLGCLLKMQRALLGLCRLDMTLEPDAPKALPACYAVSELSRDSSLTELSYHASTPYCPTTL
jgi:hypothetical protein